MSQPYAPRPALRDYIQSHILPQYAQFDAAHNLSHVNQVIANSLDLGRPLNLDPDRLYTIAAYHDVGLSAGRELHHLHSAAILGADTHLSRWFDPEALRCMQEAVEDHRASATRPPRSLYGCVVAEADRDLDPERILRRTVQYGLEHYPQLDPEAHYQRFVQHLQEKYGPEGYLRLWLPHSPNARKLERLRQKIASPTLHRVFTELYAALVSTRKSLHILPCLLALSLCLAACGSGEEAAWQAFDAEAGAPDYHKAEAWFALGGYPGKAADVFYVYPTVSDLTYEENGGSWNVPYNQAEALAGANGNQNFNRLLYKDYNFYAPYYRQMTMEVYSRASPAALQEAKARAARDVQRAFLYYMEYHNQGRPFFLVGHSQGSQMLLELLKKGMTRRQYRHMVAAYCIGFTVSEAELAAHPRRLKPATDSCGTGVFVLFNSVTRPQGISPAFASTAVGINPILWTTDSLPAARAQHRGLARYNAARDAIEFVPGLTGGRLQGRFMVCTDLADSLCFLPAYEALYPVGNLHFADSYLYGADLVHNMACRLRHFRPNRLPL